MRYPDCLADKLVLAQQRRCGFWTMARICICLFLPFLFFLLLVFGGLRLMFSRLANASCSHSHLVAGASIKSVGGDFYGVFSG